MVQQTWNTHCRVQVRPVGDWESKVVLSGRITAPRKKKMVLN